MRPAVIPAVTSASVDLAHTRVGGVYPLIDLNPLHWLGEKAKETLADGFTSMMMGLWSAGMWLLQTAFDILDGFTTPNVTDPDLARLYSVTLWVSLAVALLVGVGQVGLAVLRQDGKSLGTLAAGVVQYGVVVAGWAAVCAGVIAGTSGLTTGILRTLLDVDSFSGYAAGDGFVDTVSGTVQAAVLGVGSIFILIPAAFGHIVIMLVRAAALLILTATLPIAAAGALSEGTKSWMWKSVRWFLACSLMAPLLALVLGLGTQFAWSGLPDGNAANGSSTAANIGMSVVGAVILLVACFTPLVLFRLLAFVDPGTASGASFRSTMAANGGVAGLMGRQGGQGASGQAAGSGTAAQSAPDGRSASEGGAEAQTANRWQAGAWATVGGPVGGVIAGGMRTTGRVAQAGASMAVDVLGQSGVGNQSYYDTSYAPPGGSSRGRGLGSPRAFEQPGQPEQDDAAGGQGGVAKDVPPVAQEAVADGVIVP